jgi:hypothetical protein
MIFVNFEVLVRTSAKLAQADNFAREFANTLKIYVDIIIFYESELIKIYDEVVEEWNKNILMKEEEGYYWNEVKRKWIEK